MLFYLAKELLIKKCTLTFIPLKGVLWQQREKRFSRWKERFFILTNDYLQCFRRGTSKLSEMGTFIFRIRLCEVRFMFFSFLVENYGIRSELLTVTSNFWNLKSDFWQPTSGICFFNRKCYQTMKKKNYISKWAFFWTFTKYRISYIW